MGRPRTPTNVLDARGAFKKNPNRARTDEPSAETQLGDAPDFFTLDQVVAWNDIVSTSHAGVFCQADRSAVEIAAVLYAMFRQDPAGMPAAKLARLDSLIARFGGTPADRSKVTVQKKPAVNPFAKLVKGSRKA